METNVIKMDKTQDWFNLVTTDDIIEIFIFDEICCWGSSAQEFVDAVRMHPNAKELKIYINSPGGDIFEGMAIYSFLKFLQIPTSATILGIAASMASIVAMGCDTVIMPENAFMLIHNPWKCIAGDASELREVADMLDKLGLSMVRIYANKTGLAESEIIEIMKAETLLDGKEAVEKGFADVSTEAVLLAATFDMNKVSTTSDRIKGLFSTKGKENKADQNKSADGTEGGENENNNGGNTMSDTKGKKKDDQQPDKPAVPAKADGAQASDADKGDGEQVNDRTEFKAMVEEFGNEKAAEYFAKGLSQDDARKEYVKDLKADAKVRADADAKDKEAKNSGADAQGSDSSADDAVEVEAPHSDKWYKNFCKKSGGDWEALKAGQIDLEKRRKEKKEEDND